MAKHTGLKPSILAGNNASLGVGEQSRTKDRKDKCVAHFACNELTNDTKPPTSGRLSAGGMAERLKAAVLKTVVG